MRKAYDFEPRRVANVEPWRSPHKAQPSQADLRKIAEMEAARMASLEPKRPPTFQFIGMTRTEATIIAVLSVVLIVFVAAMAVWK